MVLIVVFERLTDNASSLDVDDGKRGVPAQSSHGDASQQTILEPLRGSTQTTCRAPVCHVYNVLKCLSYAHLPQEHSQILNHRKIIPANPNQ